MIPCTHMKRYLLALLACDDRGADHPAPGARPGTRSRRVSARTAQRHNRRRGVRVGHVTLIEGDDVRTGVTAIVPAEGNMFQDKVPGAVFVGNAFGKLAGSTQVDELGTIETPIVLTNTLSVGAAMEGVVAVHARAARQRARRFGECGSGRDQR